MFTSFDFVLVWCLLGLELVLTQFCGNLCWAVSAYVDCVRLCCQFTSACAGLCWTTSVCVSLCWSMLGCVVRLCQPMLTVLVFVDLHWTVSVYIDHWSLAVCHSWSLVTHVGLCCVYISFCLSVLICVSLIDLSS